MGNIFLYFVAVGLRAGMEGFHPVRALRLALYIIFFFISREKFCCVPIVPKCVNCCM